MAKPTSAESEAWSPAATGAAAPTHQEIAERAHRLYVQRGGRSGNAVSDWLQAERELRSRADPTPGLKK